MTTMGLNQLILFNAAWWVFATAAAFMSAILFWNKGAAQLSGSPLAGTNLAMKMSGAGAIWGITLLLFFLFHPFKGFTDVSRIVLITTIAQQAPPGSVSAKIDYAKVANDPAVVQALKESVSGDRLEVELHYKKAIYMLEQEAGSTFSYPEPIPAGFYELRVTNVDKHTQPLTRMIELPSPAPESSLQLASRSAAAPPPAVASATTPPGSPTTAPAATQAAAR